MQCSVLTHTRGTYPRVSFCTIAEEILGAHYELSVVLAGDTRARTLNVLHRKKNYIPNVLAFPLHARAGEIILNPNKAVREAPQYGHTPRTHLTFLFIHACLHLKGMDHSPRMEKLEKDYLARFVR